MKRRFDFRLARVLRVRTIEERAAAASLASAQAELAAAERTAADRRRALSDARRELGVRLAGGVLEPALVLVEQQAIDAQLSGLTAARHAVLSCQAHVQAELEAWQQREQERRALAELETRARDRHRQAVHAAENAELDETAGQRVGRGTAPPRATRPERITGKLETDSSPRRRAADPPGTSPFPSTDP